jgi:hypothetical protein
MIVTYKYQNNFTEQATVDGYSCANIYNVNKINHI